MQQEQDRTTQRAVQPAEATSPVTRVLVALGQAFVLAADWLGDRIEDLGAWIANLVRYFPARIARVVMRVATGLWAMALLLPGGARVLNRGGRKHFAAWLAARGRAGLVRVLQLIFDLLDVVGAPEIVAFVWRIVTRVSPLTGTEIAAASEVLGPHAVRYQDVRIAQGGLLNWVFRRNDNRAFCMFHTINLPLTGHHARENLHIVIHELVHVYQYERAGSRYLAEALLAQRSEGYGYGGETGLYEAHIHGKRLSNFNREQQAQIAEDFFRAGFSSGVRSPENGAREATPYQRFIDELREGKL